MTADTQNDTTLTEKQAEFCREYLIDFNATQAAIRAGYSKHSARSIGHENLTKPDIQKYLARLQKPILNQFEITRERIIHEFSTIAFSNIFDFITVCDETGVAMIDITKCTREQAAAIEQIDIIEIPSQTGSEITPDNSRKILRHKITLHDKLKALECLAKLNGIMKPEKMDITVHHKLDEMDRVEIARRIAFILRQAAEIHGTPYSRTP
ncbi:MAG: terminase small subunit [Alphaproteobacteria bacterium]|nr:terminase small subunit [Alphaproteobacteria bacterium]